MNKLAFCLLIVYGISVCIADEPKAKKVLIIGIDGLRPDALAVAKTPFLDALIKDGAYADNTQILGPRYQKNDTVSGPGWSSILTGVWADKHGVHGNDFRKTNFESYPHFFRRLKEVRPKARTASFVSWKPIAEKIVQSADVSVVTSVENKNAGEYAQAEWEHAGKAAQFLADDDGDAVFIYFGLVDSMGHTKGFHPEVREYLGAIKFTDQCVGAVLRGLVARKTFANEDWLVIVCTDHGGRGTSHSNGKDIPEIHNVFLIVSGSSAARGKIKEKTYLVDVAVTALTHLGVPIDTTWKMDGKAVGLDEHGP